MSSMADPHSVEPVFPELSPLEDPALALIREANALGSLLHPITRRSVAELLRWVNTYHSNLIEGHATRPLDIERALAGWLAPSSERRSLQLEARAHVEVQRLVEERLDAEPELGITRPKFLSFLHREFYERMPSEWRVVTDPRSERSRQVVPGQIRDEDVEVGRHVPPPASSLPRLMDHFAEVYDPARLHGLLQIIATAASHHRLLWIHPFLDGNGRVARLFTDAYLRKAGLGGHGLWTASRGLARNRARYLDALAAADSERRNPYDGRGAFSREALAGFVRFFLDTSLDQVRFMGSLLQLDALRARIEGYVERRIKGGLGPKLAPPALHLLVEALLGGEVARGDAARVTGTSDRSARRIVSLLVKEKLLVSETPKGPLRLGFPIKVVGFYFPLLFPEDALSPG
jgi:Fic family protein